MPTSSTTDNAARWRAGERLHHLFEQRCDQLRRAGKANHRAVIGDGIALSFAELDHRSNQLAHYLIAQGVEKGDHVGLLFDKSLHTYIALLAVLKAGAAYVPLDAGFPPKRLQFITSDASVEVILSLSSLAANLAEYPGRKIFLDTSESDITRFSGSRPNHKPPREDELCYIIYTSGTTGNPKGVAVEHSSICNFVKVAGEVYGYRQSDRVYQGMTIAFDFSVEELWVPLIRGATLVPGRAGVNLIGNELASFIEEHRITALCCVPTLLATIEKELPHLRFLLVSGETCPQNLVRRWQRPGRVMLNAYGPTEATVTASLTELRQNEPVTIGRPLPTYTIVILDESDNREVPAGSLGEICIAGIGLAKGYVNRDDLTARKFIPDFLGIPNNPSKRIYRTGDLGRVNENGEIEIYGRIDTQVKIRGYRIELSEIESALLQFPEIAQVVVNPYEPEPGTVELVAYFTLRKNACTLSLEAMFKMLRRQLPEYMMPAYFVELASIPLSMSGKLDRKQLPPPHGPRFCGRRKKFVAPKSRIEKALADALCEVMKLDRISIDDEFFDDLGAHSLLMARYCSEIRRRLDRAAVSMRDIYLNPSIRRLAAQLRGAPRELGAQLVRNPLRIPTNLEYYGCGFLQLLFYLGYSALAVLALVEMAKWSFAVTDDRAEMYLRLIACVIAAFFGATAIAIGLKWLLIGRWKEEIIPIWSLRYFAFWLVKTLTQNAPVVLFVGSPIYNIYLRLLGARIGRHAVILCRSVPVCTDLISIGSGTILRKESILLGYKAESNYIFTGRVHIGDNAFVGEASVLDIGTAMGDGTQLGHASSLQSGQTVPDGKRFHGSPGEETTANYCPLQPVLCTSLRRGAYAGLQLSTLLALPSALIIVLQQITHSVWHFTELTELGETNAAADIGLRAFELSTVLFWGGLVGGLLLMFAIPRLCNVFLRPNKTYVLYGFHHALQSTIARFSNSTFYNNLFGDSSAVVYYLKWLGYRFGHLVQTGSNFGTSQRQDNPLLCTVGSATMVSDALSIVNWHMGSSSFQLRSIEIGSKCYLGNRVIYPPDAHIGSNCLLGTKVLVPIEGPSRENCGLLGSPPFFIPRVTDQDQRLRDSVSKEERRHQLRKKNMHNLWTAALFILRDWFLLYVWVISIAASIHYYNTLGHIAPIVSAISIFLFTIAYLALIERATLKFRRLEPKTVSIYDEYYWFHERHWKFCDLWFQLMFPGTPFKTVLMRLLGVKMGKKVFDDGCLFIDKTLVDIGDYANLNVGTTIQGHSLEEGVFKSDYIKIGRGCTSGCGAWVHYGVTMNEGVVLEPDSFLMKGEAPDSNTVWCGNPARAVRASASACDVDRSFASHRQRSQPRPHQAARGQLKNRSIPATDVEAPAVAQTDPMPNGVMHNGRPC